MPEKKVIFISAVSDEFHRCPPELQHTFQSYRDVLKEAFRMLAPHYEVVTQETLPQGPDGLLATLDHEIARSLLVVHLVGDAAGYVPEPACVRRLYQRNPNLLAAAPELKAALMDESGVSYTQWEIYLGFHHQKKPLIFEALPDTTRSPHFTPDAAGRGSQEKHRQRLATTGAHRGPFYDQGDVARRTMRTFLHFRLDPTVDSLEPEPEAVDEAWRNQEKIVQELATAIKKPDPHLVPVTDKANVAAFVAAVRACAARWHVNLATIVNIAARREEAIRAAADKRPAPDVFYELALAELALGDYTAAQFTARRAADLARSQLHPYSPDAEADRQNAINALLLAHAAAKAAHDERNALDLLEEAGKLVDREMEPLFWADIHEMIAETQLVLEHFGEANNIINQIVQIRTGLQADNKPRLAQSWLLQSELLNRLGNHTQAEEVARRALHVFEAQAPPCLFGVAAAYSHLASALSACNQLQEAKLCCVSDIKITSHLYGKRHPKVAIGLESLGNILWKMKEGDKAERAHRRSQAILVEYPWLDELQVASACRDFAIVLAGRGCFAEAAPLYCRARQLLVKNLGHDHQKVVRWTWGLAAVLASSGQLGEAQSLMESSLETALRLDTLKTGSLLIDEAASRFAWILKTYLNQSEDQILTKLQVVAEPYGARFRPPS